MRKISQASIEELIASQMELLANQSSEQSDVARYGFKGVLNMNEEEILKEFKNHGIQPVYELA